LILRRLDMDVSSDVRAMLAVIHSISDPGHNALPPL